MQSINDVKVKNEIIVKRISASKFEVYDGTPTPIGEKSEPVKPAEKITEDTEKGKNNQQTISAESLMPRKTVIQKAPPAAKNANIDYRREEGSPVLPEKRRKLENLNANSSSSSVILIKDAILYRIVDILMWKVIGEHQLKVCGYPVAPTHQVLWRVLYQNCLRMGAKKVMPEPYTQDHDCGGNIGCFANHVYQFLKMFAPNLWKRTDWSKFSIEEILRKIYYEDLIPYLRNMDLRNNINILQCHSDIVLLEKWEKQKFTAVTWSGQKYFSQMSVNCPKCPQCSNRHF